MGFWRINSDLHFSVKLDTEDKSRQMDVFTLTEDSLSFRHDDETLIRTT